MSTLVAGLEVHVTGAVGTLAGWATTQTDLVLTRRVGLLVYIVYSSNYKTKLKRVFSTYWLHSWWRSGKLLLLSRKFLRDLKPRLCSTLLYAEG